MSDPSLPDQPSPEEPANLRFLRLLVTTLTAVMTCGLVIVVALLVTRLNQTPVPQLPDQIALPAGVSALAITAGPGWYAVVTDDDRVLVYREGSGELIKSADLTAEPN